MTRVGRRKRHRIIACRANGKRIFSPGGPLNINARLNSFGKTDNQHHKGCTDFSDDAVVKNRLKARCVGHQMRSGRPISNVSSHAQAGIHDWGT